MRLCSSSIFSFSFAVIFFGRSYASERFTAGIPVQCNSTDTLYLKLRNGDQIGDVCGHRRAVLQQVECMENVRVTTNSCFVTILPILAQGSVYINFPCASFSWQGHSIAGRVASINLNVNISSICYYLSNTINSQNASELLPLCNITASRNRNYTNTQLVTSLFGCNAATTFEDANQTGTQTSPVFLALFVMLAVVVGTISIVFVYGMWRWWRSRRLWKQREIVELLQVCSDMTGQASPEPIPQNLDTGDQSAAATDWVARPAARGMG